MRLHCAVMVTYPSGCRWCRSGGADWKSGRRRWCGQRGCRCRGGTVLVHSNAVHETTCGLWLPNIHSNLLLQFLPIPFQRRLQHTSTVVGFEELVRLRVESTARRAYIRAHIQARITSCTAQLHKPVASRVSTHFLGQSCFQLRALFVSFLHYFSLLNSEFFLVGRNGEPKVKHIRFHLTVYVAVGRKVLRSGWAGVLCTPTALTHMYSAQN